jgi:hypothetical protein|tara:strand:- start:2970 stop:3233 length:264 start_codon:yes stop_codon:yes gene_type:complete
MVSLKWSRGTGNKKYKVVVKRKVRGKDTKRTIQFGDKRYGQFRDKTPLKLYSSKNTNSTKRRKAYKARHTYAKPKYSAGWFANKYLW